MIRRFTSLSILLPALGLGGLMGCATTWDIATYPVRGVTDYAASKVKHYLFNPGKVIDDARSLRDGFLNVVRLLQGDAEKQWGEGDTPTSGTRRVVKYTDRYKTRALVAFTQKRITVETVVQENVNDHLIRGLADALLTPEDPRAVDLYSDAPIHDGGKPFLHGLVLDHRSRPITTRTQALAFAQEMVVARSGTRKNANGKRVHFVQVPMVARVTKAQVARYKPLVVKNADEFQLEPSLIFAIMETESAFNPYAVSRAPAFGLMQLVPTTGGRDAYRLVERRDGIPSQDELFTPARNIRLGSAYLHILNTRYLAGIRHPTSRLYCVISAYNGGAGNVLNTFSRDRREAVRIINGMSPSQVKTHLLNRHPRAESRRYLAKVLQKRPKYAGAI